MFTWYNTFLKHIKHDSVCYQSESTCLHQTVNMVVFSFKIDKNTYPKQRAFMQIYKGISQTKKGINMYASLLLFQR